MNAKRRKCSDVKYASGLFILSRILNSTLLHLIIWTDYVTNRISLSLLL
nr:unnamed protein product [Callosobruchus chinensis]